MKTTNKKFAIVVMAAFILPNLYVICIGHESFPFTHAPMFGHYIDETTLFYDFEFIGQDGQEEKILYPSYKEPMQAKDRLIRRFFFNKIYGSVEESSFSHFRDDSIESFTARMEKFFAAYFKYVHADSSTIQTVYLEVHQYDKDYRLRAKHRIGYYDILSRKFIYTWRRNL
jgi:hypothetical protein